MNSREKLLALVKKQGWTLDKTARTIVNTWSRDRVQDPHVFLRDAAHGGQWRILLDYAIRSSYTGNAIGDRLHQVHISYIAADDPLHECPDGIQRPDYHHPFGFRGGCLVLKQPRRGDPAWLWDALEAGGEGLGERAKLLITNPDLAVYLAGQLRYEEVLKYERHLETERQERELRARPLPITVDRDDFRRLTGQLVQAANAVHGADGKSDLGALLVTLHKSFAAVHDVVNDDIVLSVLDELHG